MEAKDKLLFQEFISEDCDRKAFIQKQLNQIGLDAPILQLEDKNHIYVKFPLTQYNPMFKIKTVIAHYDRVEGSPGANDNSAAVFCLIKWAEKLYKSGVVHNIRIIFTDGEELGEEGVSQQGAFALAQLYKRLKLNQDDIYVFDSIGRGQTPIICNTNISSKVSRKFINGMNELENRAVALVSEASGGRWFKLDCNYSDNASFIANGIPAVAITMLPSGEIDSLLKKGTEPETWRLFHTEGDNFDSLQTESFVLFEKILDNLVRLRTLADL